MEGGGLILRPRRGGLTIGNDELSETREFWNRVAADWQIQVGDDGDANRRFNSDPVLWRFGGDVAGLDVLDAGCGTGYLSQKLHDRGARVVGVDLSDQMIAIARAANPQIDFRVDSCTELRTIDDGQFDLLFSNYVLMDTCNLQAAISAFHRVLKPAGVAVLVFSHPCFPQSRRRTDGEPGTCYYDWQFSYFDERRCVDPPWAHFQSEFIWFHRPLSEYWRAFTSAGFTVADFDEPRITPDRYHLAQDHKQVANHSTRPYSVAFKLTKSAP